MTYRILNITIVFSTIDYPLTNQHIAGITCFEKFQYRLVSNLKDKSYLAAIMGDHRVFGGADYDSDNSFYVSLPYDVMLTSQGKFIGLVS